MYEKYIVNPCVCVCACMYIILYMHATSIINLELPAHVVACLIPPHVVYIGLCG